MGGLTIIESTNGASEHYRCLVCLDLTKHTFPPEPLTLGGKTAPELVAAVITISNVVMPVCERCTLAIREGREAALRIDVSEELIARSPAQRYRASVYTTSELAVTIVSHRLAPFPHPAYSRGFKLLNTILTRYPRYGGASDLERDLGHGIVGVFAILAGMLSIENLVNVDPSGRGRGKAAAALLALCALADEVQSPMCGAVQPNAYDDRFPVGAPADRLLAWYARVGFELIDSSSNTVFRAPRSS